MSEAEERREPDQLAGVRLPEHTQRVIGHEAAVQSLAERLAARRLPSAIMIHGPQGIGKATLAFDLTRRILTATGDLAPHQVAEQVGSMSHPNLFVLRRIIKPGNAKFSTVITVDQIARRDSVIKNPLRDRMHQTRGRPGYRVAVIDSIDDCNPSAANALLKMLEEPPPETLFVLISHRPGQLLPTIRSRCQLVALRPLPDGEVREVLADQRPGEDLDAAVSLAEGRARRGFEALALTDQGTILALRKWLVDPLRHPPAMHLMLADSLAGNRDGGESVFARDIVLQWIAGEARTAAIGQARQRLASANALWDKATAWFADADEYNLDARQTLIGLFDAIRRHAQHHALAAEPR